MSGYNKYGNDLSITSKTLPVADNHVLYDGLGAPLMKILLDNKMKAPHREDAQL